MFHYNSCANVNFDATYAINKIEQILSSQSTDNTVWACTINKVRNPSPLIQFNAHIPLIPASNQKLITLAAALLATGPDYRSQTTFYTDGIINNGTLEGNLIVSGFGAIHFTARYPKSSTIERKQHILDSLLDEFATRIRTAGIRRIGGSIIIDNSEWTNMVSNRHYPSAGPLLFHENTVDVGVTVDGITTCPQRVFGFRIQKQTRGTKQKKLTVNGKKTDIISVNTTQPSTDYWRLDRYSTDDYYRDNIQYALRKRGVEVLNNSNYAQLGKNTRKRQKLLELESLTLQELAVDVGLFSDNLRSEIIFLNLGYLQVGKANYQNAARAVQQILKNHDLKIDNYTVRDGCGLSRINRISTQNIVVLLNHLLVSKYAKIFLSCLPEAGKTGTLKNKFNPINPDGKIIGKTGSLNNVVALSGYILDRKSTPAYVYSIMQNGSFDHKATWRVIGEITNILLSTL